MTWVTYAYSKEITLTSIYDSPPFMHQGKPCGQALGGYMHTGKGFLVHGNRKPCATEVEAKLSLLKKLSARSIELTKALLKEATELGAKKPKNR